MEKHLLRRRQRWCDYIGCSKTLMKPTMQLVAINKSFIGATLPGARHQVVLGTFVLHMNLVKRRFGQKYAASKVQHASTNDSQADAVELALC